MSCRASQILDIKDRWTAYQLDSAVLLVGLTIENALNETVEAGTKDEPRLIAKYEIGDILKPEFRFPRPLTEEEKQVQAINWYKGRMGKTFKVDKEGNVSG